MLKRIDWHFLSEQKKTFFYKKLVRFISTEVGILCIKDVLDCFCEFSGSLPFSNAIQAYRMSDLENFSDTVSNFVLNECSTIFVPSHFCKESF